jgi:hypothetical protein
MSELRGSSIIRVNSEMILLILHIMLTKRLIEFLSEKPEVHAYVAQLRALDFTDDEIAARLTRLTVEAMQRVTANWIN